MRKKSKGSTGPRGGVRAGKRVLRGWSWDRHGHLVSRPVRCKREEFYIARARLAGGQTLRRAPLLVTFLKGEEVLAERCLQLRAPAGAAAGAEMLGWIETPAKTTHMCLALPVPELAEQIDEVVFHDVSERDPKCHPLANVPRWGTVQPPFAIDRIMLPTSLRGLAAVLPGTETILLERPSSRKQLARDAEGGALVIDPEWVRALKLSLADVRQVAAGGWVILSLVSYVELLQKDGVGAELKEQASRHGIMSARVEYADVPTRGLALQDVVPYTHFDEDGDFCIRGIQCNGAWRRHANDAAVATLLSSETPWEQKHGDVLSVIQAVGGGALLVTDLPWLAAGLHGPLLAPRVAEHLLRMHLAQPIADHMQYWNRWDSAETMVRDITDLARRYAPLRIQRWAGRDPRIAHLGVSVTMPGTQPRRQVLLRTGRIDQLDVHDGLPPEPMMIFMKWLAREAREETAWARRHLAGQTVVWQFDAADGLKYALNYDAAEARDGRRPTVVQLRLPQLGGPDAPVPADHVLELEEDEGIFGDGSLALQDHLTRRLRPLVERRA